VTVVPPDGAAVTGKITTAGSDLKVDAPAGARQMPLEKVQAVRDAAEQTKWQRLQHPPITALWVGFVDVGLAAASGNAKTLTFTTSFNSTRATLHDTINLHFNQIYSRGELNGVTTDTAKALRGGWSYNRNLTPHTFVSVFNDYEYDAFQNLDLRMTAGGGGGWKAWKGDRGFLDVTGGADYTREKFSTPLASTGALESPQFSRQGAELYWGNDFAFKFASRSSLKQSFRMFDNISDAGQYRLNFDLGSETKLSRWLAWQVTASDRFLSNPSPGRKTNDLLISSGIRVSFSH
jgi:hypothetical protein